MVRVCAEEDKLYLQSTLVKIKLPEGLGLLPPLSDDQQPEVSEGKYGGMAAECYRLYESFYKLDQQGLLLGTHLLGSESLPNKFAPIGDNINKLYTEATGKLASAAQAHQKAGARRREQRRAKEELQAVASEVCNLRKASKVYDDCVGSWLSSKANQIAMDWKKAPHKLLEAGTIGPTQLRQKIDLVLGEANKSLKSPVPERKRCECPESHCRICNYHAYEGGHGALMSPCCCVGINQKVHADCLQQERLEQGALSCSFWECSTCGASYRMKYRRHWLRVFTFGWVIASMIILAAVSLILIMSEVFCVIGRHPKAVELQLWWSPGSDPVRVPLVLNLPYLEYDVGYYYGGLLMCTLLRKIYTGDIFSLFQYITFVPTIFQFLEDPKLREYTFLTGNIWWLTMVYCSFNLGAMARISYTLLNQVLPKLAGEQVQDFMCSASRRSFEEFAAKTERATKNTLALLDSVPSHSQHAEEAQQPKAEVALSESNNDESTQTLEEAEKGKSHSLSVKEDKAEASAAALQPPESTKGSKHPSQQPLSANTECRPCLAGDYQGLDAGLASSACACDEAQASVQSTPTSDTPAGSLNYDEDDDGLCVCCLERQVCFKMSLCGHGAACRPCRRRLVYRQLTLQGPGQQYPRMRDLTSKHLERTVVSCPLCRQESVLTHI